MNRPLRRFKLLIPAIALAVVLTCTITDSLLVAQRQMQALPPELAAKHVQVGNLLLRDIGRAVELGIPLERLRGLDQLFADTRRAHPEIAFVQFLAASGTLAGEGPLDAARLSALPLSRAGGEPRLEAEAAIDRHVLALALTDSTGAETGRLAMGIDAGHVRGLIQERLFDIVTVQIVTAIFAVEILLLLLDHMVSRPILGLGQWAEAIGAGKAPPPLQRPGGNDLGRLLSRLHRMAARFGTDQPADQRGAGLPWTVMLRYIRFALFVFVFGDSLSLSFLPLFARDLHQPVWGLSDDVLTALPVVAYWLPSALVQLPGARLLDRFTHRRVFAVGAALAALGALGSATAPGLGSLVAARTLAGLGLGLVFMVCQAAILTHVPTERRTMGLASFTGVFFLATFAGAALGGVLAEQVGFRVAFLVSAIVVTAAALFAHLAFGPSREDRRAPPAEPPAGSAVEPAAGTDYLRLIRNPRFAGLLLLAALPNRMFNVALIFYLAPLYLNTLGHTKAEIGRMVSVYGLTMALAAPLLAALADRRGRHVESVVAGTLICALGALAVIPLANGWGVLLAVGAMGLGQALSIPSQMSLLPQVGAAEARILGLPRLYAVFRAGERVPAFLGPLLGGSLATLLGFAPAIASYGLWLAASSAGLAAIFIFSARRP